MGLSWPLGISCVGPAIRKSSLLGHVVNPLLTTLVWSRWQDIHLNLFCDFIDLDFVSVHKRAKRELGQIQP